MKPVIMFYTILIQSTVKAFSIKFSIENAPKDFWDHQDAVEDYLIDTNPNPFEATPEFEILTHSDGNE